jgi:GINS complex subunit 3
MAYYSPDSILTDAQKSPLTFDLAVPQLSPLNNGSAITQGTKLDLPLWMAEMLAVSKPAGPSTSSLASLDMPPPLGQRVMNALRADPKSVDLRAQAQFFYGLGERMFELFDEEELVEVLSDVSPEHVTGSGVKLILCRLSRNEPLRFRTRLRIRGMSTTAMEVLIS